MKDGTYASMEAGKVFDVTPLENLSEEVKEIMKRQPLNPFVKTEVRILPLYYPAGQLQGK